MYSCSINQITIQEENIMQFKTFGEFLVFIIENYNLTQRQIAEALNIDESVISKAKDHFGPRAKNLKSAERYAEVLNEKLGIAEAKDQHGIALLYLLDQDPYEYLGKNTPSDIKDPFAYRALDVLFSLPQSEREGAVRMLEAIRVVLDNTRATLDPAEHRVLEALRKISKDSPQRLSVVEMFEKLCDMNK